MFGISLSSSVDNMRHALKEALAYLRVAAPFLTSEEMSDLRLVIWELLLNAAIHGNRLDVEKSVRLEVGFDGRGLTVAVEDEGAGFDYRALLASYGVADLESEHGRGVRLAVALMDEFEFNEAGNRVCAAKRVSHMFKPRPDLVAAKAYEGAL